MPAYKCINKSVRMTQELYDYISAYRGEGFNEKFSNIILDARDSEAERNKVLARLDRQASERREYLRDTADRIGRISAELYDMYSDSRYGSH